MTIKITTTLRDVTLHDVDVELDESEVLNEMSTDDIIEHLMENTELKEILDEIDDEDIARYLKNSSDPESVLGIFDIKDVIDHLCENYGPVEVARQALANETPQDVKKLFEKLLPEETTPNEPEVTFVAADDTSSPTVFWVKVNGVTQCTLISTTVYSKHGKTECHDKEQAALLARALALGLARNAAV